MSMLDVDGELLCGCRSCGEFFRVRFPRVQRMYVTAGSRKEAVGICTLEGAGLLTIDLLLRNLLTLLTTPPPRRTHSLARCSLMAACGLIVSVNSRC